jgi:amino acid transporter
MNSNNGIVRILYAMGREGLLPRRLSRIHPVHRTPTTAIWAQAGVTAVFTFGVGFLAGPFNAYVYLGAMLTLAIIPVYVLTNVACVRYFARRADRSLLRHVILPVAGVLVLLIPVYGQVYPPPDPPLRYFPYLVVAFIVVAAVAATVMGRRNPGLLSRAGAVLASGDTGGETADPDGDDPGQRAR